VTLRGCGAWAMGTTHRVKTSFRGMSFVTLRMAQCRHLLGFEWGFTMAQRTSRQRPDEEARGSQPLDFLTSSLIIVMVGILVVGSLVGLTLLAIHSAAGDKGDAMVSTLTAGIGVIGTLVGAFLGLKLGTEDKGRVQDQAENYRQQTDKLMRAIAVLPPDQAEAVLHRADEATPRTPGRE
jgi:hypothetical protein